MKKVKTHLILMFVFFVSFLLLFTMKSYASNLPVFVNGKLATFQSDQSPYVSSTNRTMVPIRGVSDELGYSVVWNGTNGTVEVTYASNKLILPLNKNVVTLNGQSVTIDANTEIRNQHVYVPLRSVAEMMGAQVGYDGTTGNVVVTTNPYVVASGDTLYSISKKYNLTVNQIQSLNQLSSTNIVTGQKLIVDEGTVSSTTSPAPAPQPTKAIVTASLLNVRYGPGTTYGIAGTLTNQTIVDVQSQYNGWVQIQYGTLKGYVSQSYISFDVPTTSTPTPTPTTGTLSGKVIVIDPGHGGSDSGSIAVDGTYEKTLTFQYANSVKADLEAKGAKVYLTRTSDTRCGGTWDLGTTTDLQCRVDVAANVNANIFVSIHMNWTPGATGSTTYYNDTNNYDGNENPYPVQSKELATYIQNSYQPVLGLSSRGIESANFYVNRMAKMPSVLLEVGFISSSTDLSLIKTREPQTAQAIAQGIVNYFQNVK